MLMTPGPTPRAADKQPSLLDIGAATPEFVVDDMTAAGKMAPLHLWIQSRYRFDRKEIIELLKNGVHISLDVTRTRFDVADLLAFAQAGTLRLWLTTDRLPQRDIEKIMRAGAEVWLDAVAAKFQRQELLEMATFGTVVLLRAEQEFNRDEMISLASNGLKLRLNIERTRLDHKDILDIVKAANTNNPGDARRGDSL